VSIGQVILPILHNLEQVSSDEHVGSLAENLLEALKENEKVSAKVGLVFIEKSVSLRASAVVDKAYCHSIKIYICINRWKRLPHLTSPHLTFGAGSGYAT